MHRSLGTDGVCGLLAIQVTRISVAASFIFHPDLFSSLFTPSSVHVFMLQDLDAFLAVLAGTRQADGSPRLVK